MNKNIANNPWLFFLFATLWTWFFYGLTFYLCLSGESESPLGPTLIFLAMAGPLVTALSFHWISGNKVKQQDYWKRIFDFKRITFRWWLVIFLLMPAVTFISLLISGDWQNYVFKSMIGSIPFTLLVTPVVPLLEELGWRGYVLDLLQQRFSALNAALILGSVWGLWHLPAFFFFEGNGVFTNMPLGSIHFYLYFVNLVLVSVMMHWIYNNTNRSILSAILMHSMLLLLVNFGLWHWYSESIVYYSAVLFTTVVGIVSYFGPKTFRLREDYDTNC